MMKTPLLIAALAACAPLLAAGPALSADRAGPPPLAAEAPITGRTAPGGLSGQDRADIARVEDYLNQIRTLRARFVQIADDGSSMRGMFHLSRPGKMRIDYDEPVENFIVADGRFVYFWDAELEQQSNAPIGSTLADMLLRDRIDLSGDVTVTGMERGPGYLEVTLVQTADPGLGRLTLVFEERPFALRKWRVLDAQGLTTEVALMNPELGVALNQDLFYFRDPTRRRRDD